MNSDCIFCKIAAGEVPATKIYEDAEVLAFMNLHPTNKGQVLVIPKDHVENIYGLSEEMAARMMLVVKKLAIAVKNGVDADGVNLIMNNEEAAGQQIFHAHMHIIPRFNDDGLKSWPASDYLEGEIEEWGEKVKKEIM
ncbi:MAG: HIT family protein [bacterium]